MSRYEQAILAHLAAAVADSGPLTRDTPLLESGLIDSIGLVQLVQFLEERFGVRIADEDMDAELFATPASLAAYVEMRSA